MDIQTLRTANDCQTVIRIAKEEIERLKSEMKVICQSDYRTTAAIKAIDNEAIMKKIRIYEEDIKEIQKEFESL